MNAMKEDVFMRGMGNMQNMMKKVQKMQKEMLQAQEELNAKQALNLAF